MPFVKEEEEDAQIVSLGDSRIKCVWDHIAILSMLTVRVVVLEYIASYIKRLRTS